MSGYPQVKPGEWVQPVRQNYKMACCDCGLVHSMDFRVIKYGNGKTKIQLRAFRDEAETAQVRKARKR